jgi:demethylmenaquinone methyltransferase/2-methoxy-6-polyprenyl-1,4-benzoquinol methylase
MSNRFYDSGDKRAARVRDLFGAIAARYDLINDLQSFGLHRSWKRKLVKMASVNPGERALDLCCGTGDVAFALAKNNASVIGLDFSQPMLAIAGKRLRQQDVAGRPGAASRSTFHPQFLCGDAQRLPFTNSQFDLVTISYGLRNLANLEDGLREMLRVARPGGRLLILDFGKPCNWIWRGLYFGYLRAIVPLFGKIFCGDWQTHAYILESLKNYPGQLGVAAAMRGLNCRNVSMTNLWGGIMSINSGEKPTES